jgi:nucleoside-diphosphate-sugar epimerase
MKIFVTGGTGFIGSHFLRAALAAGHEVVALRRPGSVARLPLDPEPQWVEGVLTDPLDGILATCDALVHLAAHGVNPAQANWEDCFRFNVQDSLALWLGAARAGIARFAVCGSCFEYGLSGERHEFIPSDAPLEPTGPYHASKAAATMAALGLAVDQGLEMTIVRPFHVYGEGEEPYRLWPALRQAALAGEDFPMTAGEQIRDFIPVEQVAALLLASLENPVEKGRPLILNAGSGEPRTIREFAESWWSNWKAPGKLLAGALPYRHGEVMRYVPRIQSLPHP